MKVSITASVALRGPTTSGATGRCFIRVGSNLAIIRLGWKVLPGTKTLAYWATKTVLFVNMVPGARGHAACSWVLWTGPRWPGRGPSWGWPRSTPLAAARTGSGRNPRCRMPSAPRPTTRGGWNKAGRHLNGRKSDRWPILVETWPKFIVVFWTTLNHQVPRLGNCDKFYFTFKFEYQLWVWIFQKFEKGQIPFCHLLN